jgi:hypothetical protein
MNLLRNMTPEFAPHYGANCRWRYMEDSGDLVLEHSFVFKLSNSYNLRFVQLCVSMLRTMRHQFRMFCSKTVCALGLPILADFVSNVIFVRSSEKVFRINAGRIVALMKHMNRVIENSSFKEKRNSVSAYNFSVHPKSAVALFVSFEASPKPTCSLVSSLINIFPKPLILFIRHIQKNTHQLRSEVHAMSRQQSWQVSNLDSLLFAATSRPKSIY